MNIIDCHCHIYPDKIAEKAAKATGKFYDIDFEMLDGKVSTLFDKAKEAGITGCLVQSVATTPKQVSSINKFIAQSVDEHQDFFIGFGTLHPDSEDIEADFNELIELGLKGVKLHPDIQGFKIDDFRMLKIYELCEGKVPILMHTGDSRYDNSNPNRLLPILKIYDNLTVIGAHFSGYSVWEDAAKELNGFKNLYIDTSSSLYYLNPDKAVELIREYGVEKTLFGTDYPMWVPKEELQRFMKLPLTDEEREMILHKNAERLLGFKR